MKNNKKGLFISFEGIDGCGKTTQIELLKKYLIEKNYEIIVTLEPGGCDIGKKLREILLFNKGFVSDVAEMFLYLADRAQHIEEIVEKNVNEGRIVLCDRCIDSTVAYQGYGRKGNIEQINILNDIATKGIKPDLTIIFDVDLETAQERVGNTKDRMEKEGFEKKFWHEKNSLRFVDLIETLPNYEGFKENLNLTYATRDGIVCHCGEVNENNIKPRDDFFDLNLIIKGKHMPYTYEGCVVKIADKIAYLGRDIEDAYNYRFFDKEDIIALKHMGQDVMKKKVKFKDINTSALIHEFITNLCLNSSPENGLMFSDEHYLMMNKIKKFNYQKIYHNKRFKPFMEYATLVINTIYDFILDHYDSYNTINKLAKYSKFYPTSTIDFSDWLIKYSNIDEKTHKLRKYRNKIIYATIAKPNVIFIAFELSLNIVYESIGKIAVTIPSINLSNVTYAVW